MDAWESCLGYPNIQEEWNNSIESKSGPSSLSRKLSKKLFSVLWLTDFKGICIRQSFRLCEVISCCYQIIVWCQTKSENLRIRFHK